MNENVPRRLSSCGVADDDGVAVTERGEDSSSVSGDRCAGCEDEKDCTSLMEDNDAVQESVLLLLRVMRMVGKQEVTTAFIMVIRCK